MIQIKDLKFSYGKQQIFDNLNVDFLQGKIYGLLGLNGAGKSTLLYLISGLLFAENGLVEFNGFDMKNRNPKALEDLFFVPEEFDFPAIKLNDYEKINAPFYPNFCHEKFINTLQIFGIQEDCRLDKLSMGQKKKALISFALATNAALIIMDEPTNGLDIPSKSQYRKAVAKCLDDYQTMIISTHQVSDVENIIDHIAIIDGGKVVFNQSVTTIEEKLAFMDLKIGDNNFKEIYHQPSPNGKLAIVIKTPELQETPINIETLFNAVLANRTEFSKIFS